MRTYFILLSLCFILEGCISGSKIISSEKTIVQLTDSIAPDSAILKIIEPYKEIVDKQMNEVLIKSSTPFIKSQPEGELGNFVADLVLQKGNQLYKSEDNIQIDLCILNNGGLRTSLPKGEISRRKIFELMPFENELVVVTISGEKAKSLFNYVAENDGVPVSGIKMGIKDHQPTNIMINEKPFDPNKTYKVISSDYLALGGDKMAFFKNPVKYEVLGIKLRDVIIDYLISENKKGVTISGKKDGRVYYE